MSEKAMQQSAEAPQLDSAHPDSLPAAANPQQLLTLYTEALRFDSEHPEACHPPDNLPAPASPQQLLALFAETMARDTATTDQSLPPPWSDEHFAILWGPNWPGHPFRQPPLLWHKHLREPDVTKLICSLCCDDFSGERWLRRKAFLHALWDVQDWSDTDAIPPLPSDDSIYKRMRCTAEHPVPSNKNNSTGNITKKTLWLDIFFSADKDKDGNEFHYAVEVKFGAPVDNDLEAYNSFVCEEYKPHQPTCCLSVLVCDRKQISNIIYKPGEKRYPIAEWHHFLKAWEVRLHEMDDNDAQFAQLRNSIWRKI